MPNSYLPGFGDCDFSALNWGSERDRCASALRASDIDPPVLDRKTLLRRNALVALRPNHDSVDKMDATLADVDHLAIVVIHRHSEILSFDSHGERLFLKLGLDSRR